MPDKEGAEEKTTKSVVSKRQKQMMGEEGYDVARDMGRVKPSKDKKDATSYPVSDEVKKTQKVNKGPSALERVKKKYKGQIMDVKKEELDLTKVAEAFGGFIIEKKDKQFKQGKLFKFKSGAKGEIASGSPEMGGESEKFVKGKKKKFNILTDPDPDADSLAAKSETDLGAKQDVDKEINKAKAEKNLKSKVKTGTTKAGEDASKIVKKTPTTTPKVTGDTTPKQGTVFGGQDDVKTKRKSDGGRPRGSRTRYYVNTSKIKTSPGQQTLDLGDVKGKKSPRMYKKGDTVRTDLRTVTRTRRARKATPKELERTKAQVAATDKKEKEKFRTPSRIERAIGTAPEKGTVRRKKTKPGIAGVIQRVRRFKKAGGPEKIKTYAKTKGIEGLKYAKANPLAAVVAAGQLVDTIAPRLPKLQKPKLDVGVVGRRTAG